MSARTHVDDMHLVTLDTHLQDGAGRSLLRTTVIERPNAVGVIAYDDRRDVVVLIEQFRAGPYVEAGVRTMLEIVAGYGDPGESERDAARRQLQEETSLVTDRLFHVSHYFPAPTLSTESMSLWCAFVDSDLALERTATGPERIRSVQVSGEQAVALMLENRVSNALTLTAVPWLAQVRQVLRRWGDPS